MDLLAEEFLELKCNSVAKDDFEYVLVYSNISNVAMRISLLFLATFMYESGCSTLVSMKAKARNKLDCKTDMQYALSLTKP